MVQIIDDQRRQREETDSPWGLFAVEKFIGSVLMSGRVQDLDPLSCILISEVDTGKSEVLKQYGNNEGVLVINDATSYGLVNTLAGKIQRGELHHIIIPDLWKIRSRSRNVSKQVISTLNIMAEEGLQGVQTYNTQILVDKPLKCGFLTSITLSEYENAKRYWKQVGFSSRIIPIFFGYNKVDMERARKEVLHDENPFREISLPEVKRMKVEISEERRGEIRKVADSVAKVGGDYTRFRSIKQMIGLAKSHALLDERSEANTYDIRFLHSLVPFCFNPILGNDCHYRIIRELPAKSEEIVEKLADYYGRSTIYRHKRELAEKGIIERKDDGIWTTTY